MKKQVIVIHGGDTFDSYSEYLAALKNAKLDFKNLRVRRWKETLGEKLGKSYEVIAPSMPNSKNARYLEWKIWFEKLIPHFNREVVLVGHSLGGVFLAKYLSEKKFPRKIREVFLVAPPFKGNDAKDSIGDFTMPRNVNRLKSLGDKVHLYHSSDDKLVRTHDFNRYLKVLPDTQARIFKNRGHFTGEKFPEIVNDIKALYK